MALSDLIVRQAKTAGKRYTLYDNDCLSLMVSAAGGKSWIFRYCWLGKQKHMSLGSYPALSLREARAERDKAQVLLAKGIDPQIEHDQRRHAAKLAGEYTFKNVFDAWVEHRRKELKEGRQSTLSQILRIFNKDVLPTLGKMSIYDIRRPQLLGVLAAIEKRKAFTTAEKVRTWFNQMFRYALVVAEGLEINPAADLDVVAEPKPPVAHNPYLHLPELPEFLQKLRRYNPRGYQTQLGVRLLFLTGVRTGELRLAEPEQFDLDRGIWIIPPQIVKQLQDEMRKAGKRPQDVPALHRAPVCAGPRSRALPAGCDAASTEVPAGAPQRTQEAHQREHPQQGLAVHGLRGAPDRPRHPRHHFDRTQRDRIPEDLGGRTAFALRSQQGQLGLQPRQVRGATTSHDAGLGRPPRPA